MLVTAAATNAVNLTDGLDGLAAGTSLMALGAYALISWKAGLPEIATGCVSLAGGCLGFLWFNAFPARIFMGDTGSLALGGALATAAILTRTEWLFVLIGGVFVAEALSVILQVLWFKMTKGGRIFKMSPLHHHFTYDSKDPSERPPHILKGREWHEVQTSTRFSLTALVLAALGVLIYFRG
jgi:phospho-N-acetylmuramoyl-pentapeptide-transferase